MVTQKHYILSPHTPTLPKTHNNVHPIFRLNQRTRRQTKQFTCKQRKRRTSKKIKSRQEQEDGELTRQDMKAYMKMIKMWQNLLSYANDDRLIKQYINLITIEREETLGRYKAIDEVCLKDTT